jgi:hypothetical protein
VLPVASVRRDNAIGCIDHGQDVRPRDNRGRTHRAGTAAAYRLGTSGSPNSTLQMKWPAQWRINRALCPVSRAQRSSASHRRHSFVVLPSLSKRYPPPRSRTRVENWWRQHLSKTIYVFRCSGTGLYALTADPSGHILPSRIYPRIRWRFERRVTVQKNSPKQKLVRATLDAIAKHGFYLTHKAIDAELAQV